MKETSKIISGIKWTGIQFSIDIIFRFSLRLILATILLPKDFGLVGMCIVFIAISNSLADLGLSSALIQKKNDLKVIKMYSTAFWTGLIMSIILYLVLSFLVAPLASSYFSEPLLKRLIPALSLVILLKPFIMIHNVILQRNLEFKTISKILNFSTLIAGLISICTAFFLKFGVWAIVVNNVLAVLISLPLLLKNTKWRPKMKWNKNYFKDIFGFGLYSSSTNIFSTLTYNIDNLMIGKLLGSVALGYYSLSFSMTEQLRQSISSIVNKVMYPVFGKIQHNKFKLKYYFLQIINMNAMIMFPIMISFIIFGEELIFSFLGEKWVNAVIPLKILSIAIMIHLLINSFASLIRGIGKPALEMKILVGLTIFCLLPLLYIGIIKFGLVGASLAILLNKIVLVFIALFNLKKLISVSFLDVLKEIRNPIYSLIIATITYLLLKKILMLNVIFYLIIFFIIYMMAIYKLERNKIILLINKLKVQAQK